ncbi:hypothetical protein B0H10DRAFT_2073011 [Mycena sp. CBHHK59/15]|nr:hypothetical protein B0H10DRAFT_2073011 [Mycena sp. CBHHK59/15]
MCTARSSRHLTMVLHAIDTAAAGWGRQEGGAGWYMGRDSLSPIACVEAVSKPGTRLATPPESATTKAWCAHTHPHAHRTRAAALPNIQLTTASCKVHGHGAVADDG